MGKVKLVERHCALCGPEVSKRFQYPATFREEDLSEHLFSARRLPDQVHFRWVCCERCKMLFSDPACGVELLEIFYQRSKVNYSQMEESIYSSYSPILDRAVKYLDKKDRRDTFVEIGGGSGFMLKYGVQSGFKRQIEVEPSQDALNKFTPPSKEAQFVCESFSENSLPGATDLICFFQVLDHISDPMKFLTSVHKALRPGGIVVCVTHDAEAWTARLLGSKSPIFDIEHTYLYNRSNLSALFQKAGFECLEIFPVSNRYSLGYWVNLSPLPLKLKSTCLAFLEFLKMDRFKLNVNFGNFGIIAQKRN